MTHHNGPAAGGARPPRDTGTVTAELALLLPAVTLLLLVLLAAAAAGVTQLRVADAARAGARAAAIGEGTSQIAATARQLAGGGAEVVVGTEDGFVVVEVSRPLPGILAGTRARATARAIPEPSAAPALGAASVEPTLPEARTESAAPDPSVARTPLAAVGWEAPDGLM